MIASAATSVRLAFNTADQELQVLLRHVQRQLDELILHNLRAGQHHQDETAGVRTEDFKMLDRGLRRGPGHRVSRQIGQLGDHLAHLAHNLGQTPGA